MSPPLLILASGPRANAQASKVAADLSALGFNVTPASLRRAKAAKIETAHKVVLLWSRAARGTPALRAAAQRAKAKGKLVCVALDAAPPPLGAKAQKLPRQRLAWRRLLGSKHRAVVAPLKLAPQPLRPQRAKRIARAAMSAPQAKATTAARPAPKPQQPRAGSMVALLFGSVTALALVLLAGVAEAYASDASFAARVDAWVQNAKTLVTSLAS